MEEKTTRKTMVGLQQRNGDLKEDVEVFETPSIRAAS